MANASEALYNINKGILPRDAFIVIVRTQWNPETVDKLLEGCIHILEEFEMHNYRVVTVPGAFEIPFAIKDFWETNKDKSETGSKPAAFIALGCVLRGGTPHFEYVSGAVTDGILQLNLMLPVPTIFGILTLNNQQQADERTGGVHGHKGEEAALSALKMIELKYAVY